MATNVVISDSLDYNFPPGQFMDSGTSPLQIISTREFELFVLHWKFWRRVIENSSGTKLLKVTFLLSNNRF